MTVTIYYYVHGRGRGHASRSRPIVEALRELGYAVQVHAGEDARATFEKVGGAMPIASTPLGIGPSSVAAVARRLRADLKAMRAGRPKLLISDGDLPAMLAARITRVPAIAVGHGLVFARCVRPPGIDRRAWLREYAKARLASAGAARSVAVSFVPLTPIDERHTVVVRPTLRTTLGERETPTDEVLCYLRDENGDRVLQWLVELGARSVLFTARPPEQVSVGGVEIRSHDTDAFARVLRRARAVVSSAGSQLISECAYLGVPQFALFDRYDDEQRLNVALLEHFSMGAGVAFDACCREDLAHFLQQTDRPRLPVALPERDAVQAICELVRSLLPAR